MTLGYKIIILNFMDPYPQSATAGQGSDRKLLVKRIAAAEGETIERNGAILTVPEGGTFI